MTITLSQLKEKLAKIDWDINIDDLQDNIPLIEQGLDSLDMINLLFCLEENFPVKIPDEDLPVLTTLRDFTDYINNKLS
jgi:acyl carrier protein